MDRAERTRELASIQRRQLGVVTAEQARALGYSRAALDAEIEAGRLRRIRPRVFVATNARASYEQEVLAAVLSAAGALYAAASHETAAYLHLPAAWRGARPGIEVLTPLGRQPRIEGVRLHRSGHFFPADVCHLGALPLTSVTRALVDVSMRLDRRRFGELLDEALRRKLVTLGGLQREMLRVRNASGRSLSRVITAVRDRTGEDASESMLELFAIDALKRFGVRLPTQQHPVRARGGRPRRIDLAYEVERFAIEALGFEHHGRRSRFDDDAVRNNELVKAGYRPLFVTSAMTDWEVAALIADAIGDPVPERPARELTFADWKRQRHL